MPWFIDNTALRTAAWLIGEAVSVALSPINRKLDRIMSLVTVDSDQIDAVVTGLTDLENEFTAFVSNLPTAPPAGSLDGVTSVLGDFKSKLDALVTPAAPVDPPADPSA